MQNVRFSTFLGIQDREDECGKGTDLNWGEGGGTPHILPEQVDKRGDTTYQKLVTCSCVGTLHKISDISCWWVGGWPGSSKNNATTWLHLAR